MPTKQELLQHYFNFDDALLIDCIHKETFTPEDINGIFSFNAYNNKTEIVKAFLQKCKPTQAELDNCFAGQLLNNETLDLLLPLQPSPEKLGGMVFTACSDFQMYQAPNPLSETFTQAEKDNRLALIERLMNAGALLQDHQNYDAARVCFQNGKDEWVPKYFDKPGALRWFLQFCCRSGNEKMKVYVLAKKINYANEEGIALLTSAMIDNDIDLFNKTLQQVQNFNLSISGYNSILDDAISYDNLDVVKILIGKGARPLENGKNTLMLAMDSKSAALPKLIIETFQLDFQMNNNECLVAACNKGKLDIVRLLLEKGADVHCQKNACLKFAVKNKYEELHSLLKQFGANDLAIAPYTFNCDVATADFETLWKEWLVYYKKFFPSAEKSTVNIDSYNPILLPASKADIKLCEEKITIPFNEELAIIYKHCTQGEYLFFGMFLMSPTEMSRSWQSWMDVGFVGLVENDQHYPMHPEGTIQPHYINAKWLSFASDLTSNYVSIDYDPASKGKMGQIINSGRDQYERYVIASSITELARKVMHKVEANEVEITAEGYFYLMAAGGQGFLYDVLNLIKEGRW
jgi:cell wall assembly regulator SMI1